jgi:betaine-aldehyde dehydrogenase
VSERSYQQFIGGRYDASSGSGVVERKSPANGRLVARYADGVPEDIDLAVEAARAAFENGPWPRMSGLKRSRLLNRLADLIEANHERLVLIEVEEVGKPIRFARGDIDGAVGLTRYAASLAMQMVGLTYTRLGADKTAPMTREAIGVVALVTPWNFPALIMSQKAPSALAAGCTAVLKPSEFTSGSAFEIAALATEVGVPAGVLNVVRGYGATVGDRLSKQAAVEAVAARLGLAQHECAAAGDAENDIEMLAWVGTAVTVGNAVPEVKLLAHFIASTCDEGGLADALTWLMRPQEVLSATR